MNKRLVLLNPVSTFNLNWSFLVFQKFVNQKQNRLQTAPVGSRPNYNQGPLEDNQVYHEDQEMEEQPEEDQNAFDGNQEWLIFKNFVKLKFSNSWFRGLKLIKKVVLV